MSVDPSAVMSEAWTRWQGQVVRDQFPLGRFLGSSDHSGVFATASATLGASEFAIKLVPADRALAEVQLPRWKRAGALTHPQLLRPVQWGGCQLDGLPYLYLVMECADQTLAQVLQRRALVADEAREMLLPTLDALAFLHAQRLVHGQVKPTNLLAVGDQLKLAGDTVRRMSDGATATDTPTAYDPPEVPHTGKTAAGDVWALGACLFEALTRQPPARPVGDPLTLPPDFPASFRDAVAQCLNPNPANRPTVTELVAWARGPATGAVPVAAAQPAATLEPAPRSSEPMPLAAPQSPAPPLARRTRAPPAASPSPRTVRVVVIGAVIAVAVGGIGLRMIGTAHGPARQTAADDGQPATAADAPPAADGGGTGSTTPAPRPTNPAAAPVLHEVIPEVSESARRTIRGHIKVWVRVIVDPDGTVFAATADRSGPSRYFERLAIDAARKWTFPPTDAPGRRVMEIRFEFSRDATTGRALTVR